MQLTFGRASRACRRPPAVQRQHAQHRATIASPAGQLRRSVSVNASLEYTSLSGVQVFRAQDGEQTDLLQAINAPSDTVTVLVCLTHFADLSSWELAQKLVPILPTLDAAGVRLAAVGLGSPANASAFAEIMQFPIERLYSDPDGSTHKALQWSPGFGETLPVSAYAKLLPMLMGIGSPGTIQEVLRGYIGDRDAKPVFPGSTPFDILGTGYQRPFELATLRLFNMVGILPKWGDLSPPREELLTQQGGTVAFRGGELVFKHADSGILKYTDVDELLAAVLSPPPAALAAPSGAAETTV